ARQSALRASNSTATPADEATTVQQTVAWLVSPQATFAAKQAAWKQLRDDGRLDEVVKELAKQAAEHPDVAEYNATLGQAYLQQIRGVKEMRDQAILGMKADESFENALKADPNNWEARFFRASAMSYWPESMNKGPEVINQFRQLID